MFHSFRDHDSYWIVFEGSLSGLTKPVNNSSRRTTDRCLRPQGKAKENPRTKVPWSQRSCQQQTLQHYVDMVKLFCRLPGSKQVPILIHIKDHPEACCGYKERGSNGIHQTFQLTNHSSSQFQIESTYNL